ncbi:17234_t:CDS:1, partial [Acaulospora colombiana]
ASSQPPEGGLGLHGVPQQFIHHHQVKKQQQSHQQNMNVTPFHHPMQLVQTPMAFSPQMLQFPTTPGMGAIPLQNGHPVQHPHQPQVVPKKKKHVEMK